MKENFAKILLGLVVVLTSYLFVANVIHIVLVRQSTTYDFNRKEMKEVKENIKKFKQTKEVIEYYLPQSSVFNANEKETIQNQLKLVEKTIDGNILLTLHGKKKINAAFLYDLDKKQQSYITGIISILNILIKYDDSFKDYLDLYKVEFITNGYGRNATYTNVSDSYQYQDRDVYFDCVSQPENVALLARIYAFNEYVVKANYISEFIIKVGELHE